MIDHEALYWESDNAGWRVRHTAIESFRVEDSDEPYVHLHTVAGRDFYLDGENAKTFINVMGL